MRDPDISPAAALRRVAAYTPDTVSLVYGDRRWTAAALDRDSAGLAAVLTAGGVGRGDRVAYLGLNSATLVQGLLACARLGAVFVPVNFRLAAEEVEHVLGDCDAHTVLVEEGHRGVAETVADRLGVVRWLLVDDDPLAPVPADAVLPGPRWRLLGRERAGASGPPAAPVRLTWDDLALLMYTSGTTGLPKGVELTHGNVWWNNVNVSTVIDTRVRDVVLATAPMFHIGGLNVFAVDQLVSGGTVVAVRHFDPDEVLRLVPELGVTSMFGVPAMFGALERSRLFADTDLSTLRAVVVAGAPVPPNLIARWADRGVHLEQAWGLTETAPFATHLPGVLTRTKLGSAGAPMPHTEVRLCHPGTVEVVDEPGERGEVCVRGPNVTRGYWRNEAATIAAFDEEGWFRSGDIGYLDVDGFLYIVDRVKDMIITGGENVYPAEVERVVIDVPGVVDVAVVGLPDERWGETVAAMVVCAEGASPTLEEVREYAAGHLARYKLPTHLYVVDALPRNGSGKLDKLAIRRTSMTLLATETPTPPRTPPGTPPPIPTP